MLSGLHQLLTALLLEPPVLGLIERLPYFRDRVPPGRRTHPFDRVHGTRTSGVTSMPSLDEAGGTARYPYHGSQPSIVRTVLASLPDRETYSFVDLGSGKGRVLIIASEFGFKNVLGVEIEPRLAKTSLRNAGRVARRHPGRTPVQVDVADAFAYELPAEMADRTVYFLYNPFGPEAIKIFAEHLERRLAAGAEHLFVVYYNPLWGKLFDDSDHLSRWSAEQLDHAEDERGFIPPLTSEAVVVWQSEPAGFPARDSAHRPIRQVPGEFHVTVQH